MTFAELMELTRAGWTKEEIIALGKTEPDPAPAQVEPDPTPAQEEGEPANEVDALKAEIAELRKAIHKQNINSVSKEPEKTLTVEEVLTAFIGG